MEHAVTIGMVVYAGLGLLGLAGLFVILTAILAAYAHGFNN